MKEFVTITRIQYIKEGDKLTSKQPILCDTIMVSVSIDVPSITAKLKHSVKGTVLRELQESTLPLLKMSIKKTLKQMGGRFNDEVRISKRIKKLFDGVK